MWRRIAAVAASFLALFVTTGLGFVPRHSPPRLPTKALRSRDAHDVDNLVCSIDYYGSDGIATRAHNINDRCFDATLTEKEAAETVLVASRGLSAAVDGAALADALRCLQATTHSTLPPLRELAGFYKLVFARGPAVRDLPHKQGGYVSQPLDMRIGIDTISIDTSAGLLRGLKGSLMGRYLVRDGGFLSANFDSIKLFGGVVELKGSVAKFVSEMCSTPLTLRPFFFADGVLAVWCKSSGKEGMMLFQREDDLSYSHSRAEANAIKHSHSIMNLHVTAAAAGEQRASSQANKKEDEASEPAEPVRLEDMPGYMPWQEYAETECPRIYAVLAGPTLLAYLKHAIPIWEVKLTTAMNVITSFAAHHGG